MNFSIELGDIKFSFHFYWDCDVDVIFQETVNTIAAGTPHTITKKTPTAGSIDKAFKTMLLDTDWSDLKVNCCESYGLMMGTAHITFKTSIDNYNRNLVNEVKKRVKHIMCKYVKYYKAETT